MFCQPKTNNINIIIINPLFVSRLEILTNGYYMFTVLQYYSTYLIYKKKIYGYNILTGQFSPKVLLGYTV